MIESGFHNTTLALLDTGTYPMDKLANETCDISQLLWLQQKVFPATTSFLKQLLAGPWPDDKFVHMPPHSVVDSNKYIFLEQAGTLVREA